MKNKIKSLVYFTLFICSAIFYQNSISETATEYNTQETVIELNQEEATLVAHHQK